MRALTQTLCFFTLSIMLMPAHAYAYLGPGFGFGAIASLFALGSAFFITLFNFIWLPIKRFLGLEKTVDDEPDDTERTNVADNDKEH